jgi:hypothetical protein
MSEDMITKTAPSSATLNTLVDYEFVVAFASLGLWFDVAMAAFWQSNLLNPHLRWADGIPIGAATVLLIAYGIVYIFLRRRLRADLENLWHIFYRFLSSRFPRLYKQYQWLPDPRRDIPAWELELQAAKDGNSALMTYAKNHIENLAAQFRTQNHLFLIGILFLAEALLPSSVAGQLAQGLSAVWATIFHWLLAAIGIGTMIMASKPLSVGAVYICLPRTPS